MGLDVPVYDLSVIRGLWEVRVKKHRHKQKKEQERKEKSALARIDQEWQYRIYCKTLKTNERNLLHRYLERSTLPDIQPSTEVDQHQDQICQEDQKDLDPNRLIFRLEGERWTLSSLKQLVHLDIAENRFISIPICALRMSSLQLLDLSSNQLSDLPQDMDRLSQLVTLFVHKNNLSYLPHCLTNVSTLKVIVVSGDHLTCVPTKLCSNPDIKFIRLYDNPASEEKKKKQQQEEEEKKKRRRWRQQREEQQEKDGREKEFMEAYISSLQDRDAVPYSTTKVSISCLL